MEDKNGFSNLSDLSTSFDTDNISTQEAIVTNKTSSGKSEILGVNCQGQIVGTYTDGRSGLQQHCEAHLIDPETSEWSSLGVFVGSEPPKTKTKSGDKSGARPINQIIDKLESVVSH
jgi:hypothetical protein